MIVDRVSATLGLPDTIEISVPMATNHSDICKFDQQDSAYELVIENITDLVQHALRSTRIDAPLLTPSISLTDPQNQRRTLSVASSLSLESTDVSSSTNSSMAGGGHYGMPTFQDSSGDDSSSALQLDNTPTTPVIILPYNTNSEFVGRDVVFNAIKDALRTSSTGQSRAALYGLGGVGLVIHLLTLSILLAYGSQKVSSCHPLCLLVSSNISRPFNLLAALWHR